MNQDSQKRARKTGVDYNATLLWPDFSGEVTGTLETMSSSYPVHAVGRSSLGSLLVMGGRDVSVS